ncbi:MAG TPA: ABC transporter substrate-binding protein, partial [Caldimonas sp.]|nr:ABC transporter substrate-binding protein [Caldimonas sp.]
MHRFKPLTAALLVLIAGAARADVNVGISLPLTGPASGLGIPMKNEFALWPQTIAGEKVNLIILDDATDPTKGVQNAKRFVTEDKVDIIGGSAATPVAAAMADVAADAKTVQI